MADNPITITDLQTVVNIIDVCTKRGSFEGGELLPVGQIREKFIAFIKGNTPPPTEEVETETKSAE
jgi:hypothetical protein